MTSIGKKILFIKSTQTFLFHVLFILTSILFVLIVAFPFLFETRMQLGSDQAFHAREIWELMQGRDFFLYHEGANYHGILESLVAIPFVKLMGTHPTPFHLPAAIFYGLFIWSTFLILREFNLVTGWITTIFLLFPPFWIIDWVVTKNTQVAMIVLLGNLILFYLIQIKKNGNTPLHKIFLFWFFSGLAIYAYTYSIIYIFTATLILVLTHPQWHSIRLHLTAKNLIRSFKDLRTKADYFGRFLDIIIALFIIAIIYSYIFGGFGLDIGGLTLIQINNLHKPVTQVAILIVIRLIIFRASFTTIVSSVKSHYHSIDPTTKKITIVAIAGFILGIFPRMYSILNGSITRGGQGFDVDFSPIRLVLHTFDLVTIHLIEMMGFTEPLSALFLQDSTPGFPSLQQIFVLPVAGLAGYATYSFIVPRWPLIKKIVRLESLTFSPTLILLVLPATLCISTVIIQNGPLTRYLHPVYWITTIYVALLISRISNYSKILAITLIGIWIGFYMPATKGYFQELPRWREILSPNADLPVPHVVKFLNSMGIKAVYSPGGTASEIIMYSNGTIQAAQYSKTARGKSLQKKLKNQSDFALVTVGDSLPFILSHLDSHKISYKKKLVHSLSYKNKVSSYWVIWNLKGNPSAINQLRYIYD